MRTGRAAKMLPGPSCLTGRRERRTPAAPINRPPRIRAMPCPIVDQADLPAFSTARLTRVVIGDMTAVASLIIASVFFEA